MVRFSKVGFFGSVLALNATVLLSGLVLTGTGPFRVVANVAPGSFLLDSFESKRKVTGIPTRIVVESLGIDLNVNRGEYNSQTGEWTLDNQNAYYAELTPKLSNFYGNTLIYGHNIPEVFKRLHELQEGTELVVYTDAGDRFMYVYQSSQEVRPNETQVLSQETLAQVTLQTCSGNWNEYRRLFTFSLRMWQEA